jgi:AraC family transcriptional regulator, arabinose operon regulatory protein
LPTRRQGGSMSERTKSVGPGKAIGDQHREADYRVRKVLSAVKMDPALDIQGLAHMVSLSSSRLSHLFKTSTGSSLQNFLSNWRLEKAAGLLQSTEMPVKEISYFVGYRHAPSFVRAFRKRYGYSPNDYRNQQRLMLSNS